ncbi:MAG: L-threonylcarbamoyladenylate synthase [Bacteroidales bacterium]|nr:L-threonylcarbamoyladenylate synthase [Bacteroidales bacterium]
METYKLYENNPNSRILQDIARVIRDGGIIIYPTDSVYAIGCDALNQRAVEKIYQYRKEDAKTGHLSIICKDISQADEYTKISKEQYKLMHRHLPGPFTFILETGLKLPKVFRSRKTVGIRVPNNKILHALLEELDGPILTTSLKVPVVEEEEIDPGYMTDPFLIEETFRHQADILIDGGYGQEQPSTVVDLTGDAPEIVRQGVGELEL